MENETTYISSDGTEKDVREMNSVYLLSAYAKAIKVKTQDEEIGNVPEKDVLSNIEVCKNEILRRIALGEEKKTA